MKALKMKTDNELVAEFLGWKVCECGQGPLHYKTGDKIWQTEEPKNMKFKTSWDWLHPVIDKIDEIYQKNFPTNEEFVKKILAKQSPINDHYMDILGLPVSTAIDEVFEAAINFIKWYNQYYLKLNREQ